ncbi:MAG TPA: aryl-sulfate sulfotransferase [Polyangiaceae bacterium]
MNSGGGGASCSAKILGLLASSWLVLAPACSESTGTEGDGGGTGPQAGQGGATAGTAGGGLAGSTGGAAGSASGNTPSGGSASGLAGAGSGSIAGNGSTAGSGGTLAGSAGTASGAGSGGSGTGGGGTGGAGGNPPLGALALSNLSVEPNPKMSLSCYVSWTTAEPANSEVQFGVGGYTLRIVDDALVTEHRVHVLGMHAETAYDLKAVSTNQTATGSAESDFTTGPLPENAPEKGTLVASETSKMQPGWTLTNFHVGGSSNFSTSPAIILILDEEAIPVWYFVHGDSADQFGMTSTVWLPNGNILIGNASAEPPREVDLEGNVVWEGPTGGSPAASHHTGKLATGNYLMVRESNQSARVEEVSPENQVVWSWDLYDHLQPKTSAADWCHLNSVSVNADERFLYFNCRFQGLFKVDRQSGDLLWQMGAAIDDSQTGDVRYLPDNSVRFNDAHDPQVHADGSVLFYDNDGWPSHMGGENNGDLHSRVVEYTLDETTKEATLSWEFPGSFDVDPWYEDEWSTPIWGDADRLENGNVLVTAGIRGAGTHTRIFEVSRAGEVVWGFEWPENNGSYRANRISPPPAAPIR